MQGNTRRTPKKAEGAALGELRRRMRELCDLLKENRTSEYVTRRVRYNADMEELAQGLSEADAARLRAADREFLLEAVRDKNERARGFLGFLLSSSHPWRARCRPLDAEAANELFREATANGNEHAARTLLTHPDIGPLVSVGLEAGGVIHKLAQNRDRAGCLRVLEYLVRESPLNDGRFPPGFFPNLLEASRSEKRSGGNFDPETWGNLMGRLGVTDTAPRPTPPVKPEKRALPAARAPEPKEEPEAAAKEKPEAKAGRGGKRRGRRIKEKPFELVGRRELSRRLDDEVVDLARHPEAYAPFGIKAPASMLFYGEPGCGKTYAVNKLVEFLGWKRVEITASDVYCSEAHQSNIRKRFLQAFIAAEKGEPAAVVMDELDTFLIRRDDAGRNPWVVEEVNEFLTCIQEAHDRGVMVIGMCNSLARLDPAALRPGRFDMIVEVEMPGREEIEALLALILSSVPTAAGLNLTPLVEALVGRSLADVVCVVETALRLAGRRRKKRLDQGCLSGALEDYRLRRLRVAQALSRRRPAKVERPKGEGDAPFTLPGRRELCRRLNEEVIDLTRRPERYARFGQKAPASLLLHGEPGCGKTYAVDRLVEHLGWPCVRIEAADVYSCKAHESFIRERFDEAFLEAEVNGHAVVVMDEVDSFLGNRSSGGGHAWKVEEVNEFLLCLQQAHDKGVLVIGMCNGLDRLDPAALRPGRFDLHIEVGKPTREEARELLELGLAPYPRDPGLDLEPALNALAGKSTADVSLLLNRALRRAAAENREVLDQGDLDAALKEYRDGCRRSAQAQKRRRAPKLERPDGKGDAPFSLPGRRELSRRLNEEVINLALWPERYGRFGLKTPPSILLHGEPGCGKTYAVDRLVEHLGWPCVYIESADVYSCKAHTSFIRERFEEAFVEAEAEGRAVVVMDELDSFLSNRDNAGNNPWVLEEVNEFLTCLQEAHDKGVLVIGMCNEPDRLDPAALRPGRFDLHIEVGRPTRAEARELLEAGLALCPHDPGLDLEPALNALDGKTVADVTLLLNRARRFAAELDKEYLDQDCLDAALTDRRATRGATRKHLGPIGF